MRISTKVYMYMYMIAVEMFAFLRHPHCGVTCQKACI